MANRIALTGFDWVSKSLDAALTAPLKPKAQAGENFKAVFRRRTSNYNRIASLMNLFDRIIPGAAVHTSRRLLRFNHFPLKGYKVSLLAYGSGSTVFLLEKGQEKQVLKVFRRSLGKPTKRAWAVAQEFKEKHETLVSWFNGPFTVVVPSSFLVFHGPLLGLQSAALIQPYIAGKKRDLFLDFSIEEIIQLGSRNTRLCAQILDFTDRLFKAIEETGRCFDLIGRENLMVVESDGTFALKIADNGIFDLAFIRQNNPALFDRLQAHLHHLQMIRDGLERSKME